MKMALLFLMLAVLLVSLTGCFVEPDPVLKPLTTAEQALPFGTLEALPSATPAPAATPAPTADGNSSTWEDWGQGGQPSPTPRRAATAPPDAKSWETSSEDYNAGYPLLRVGSTGRDVSDLQARLTELGYYTGPIDGKYIAETQSAVAEFQQRNGLTADGAAGRQTQDLLYSGAAQPKTVSAMNQQDSYLLLKKGASGLEVLKLQGRLAELGYYAGGVDGIYGETTVSAVKAFQRSNGLSGDGDAGEQTQKKLYSATARYASNPVDRASPDQVRSLSLGMTGSDVYALQSRLIELHYLGGVADGVFGAETESALKAFQERNNLTADGKAGASTIQKLNGNCRPAAVATPTPLPSGAVLREGDTGEGVYNLQARLFELGYYTGRIDGRFGAETTMSVKAFQAANGLTADGIAGKGTQKKLDSGKAVVASPQQGGQGAAQPSLPQSIAPAPGLSTLRRGDKSDEVRVLQLYLHDLGYLSMEPDGQFGGATERAVKLFQEANELTADGIAGQGTLTALYSGEAVAYAEYFGGASEQETEKKPEPTAVPDMETVIQWESEGENVRQYQQRLVELGYLSKKYVTGVFNQPTVDATKAFQRMNDLKVDGAAGPQSLKLIYSDKALNASGDLPGD